MDGELSVISSSECGCLTCITHFPFVLKFACLVSPPPSSSLTSLALSSSPAPAFPLPLLPSSLWILRERMIETRPGSDSPHVELAGTEIDLKAIRKTLKAATTGSCREEARTV